MYVRNSFIIFSSCTLLFESDYRFRILEGISSTFCAIYNAADMDMTHFYVYLHNL